MSYVVTAFLLHGLLVTFTPPFLETAIACRSQEIRRTADTKQNAYIKEYAA